MAVNTSLLKRWVTGETFTARAYVYERDLIVEEVNRIANLLEQGDFVFNRVETTTLIVNATEITRNGNLTFLDVNEPAGSNILPGDIWFEQTS